MFKAEGRAAPPVAVKSGGRAVAALLSPEFFQALLDEQAELQAFRERYRASVAALASVRLEGQKPDTFGHSVLAREVAGDLSDGEALAELDRHFGHPRARAT